jgi:PhnB protein
MTQLHLSPYVNFQGRAREAMDFYQKVLGGTVDLQTTDAQGKARPAGPGDRIAHAQLDAGGSFIAGSDGHPDYPPKVGDNMAIVLAGGDRDRMTRIFKGLADGGHVKMPLADQPSGDSVGWLADRFGINWMVSVEQA